MNWYKKTASFDFQRQLKYTIDSVIRDPQTQPAIKQQLSKAMDKLHSNFAQGIREAVAILKSIGKWNEDLDRMLDLYKWYDEKFRYGYQKPQIQFNPEAPDNFGIRIQGLQLPSLETSEKIPQLKSLYSTMGNSMRQEGSDILLLSEPKVWQTFLQSTQIWFPAGAAQFANAPVAVMPDERKASGQPLSEVLKKYKNSFDLPKSVKPNKKLTAIPVPGQNDSTAGIAINFDPTDPILNEIAPSQKIKNNWISGGIESQMKIIWPPNTNVKWHYNEIQGQIIILADPNSMTQFEKYFALIKWLDNLGYNTTEISNTLATIAPDKYTKIEDSERKFDINRESSPEEIQQAMIQNVRGASQSAVKYLMSIAGGIKDANGQPIDVATVYNTKDPLNQDKLFAAIKSHARQIYPEIFKHDKEEMAEGQADAIAFGVTRDSFILGDSPGSGKTPMSAAIADLNRRIVEQNPKMQGQGQILVLTPAGLIRENWMPKEKDGKRIPATPQRFIDPQMPDTDIQIIRAYGPNGEVPAFIGKWIVIPYDMFRPFGEPVTILNLKKPKKPLKGSAPELLISYQEQLAAFNNEQIIIKRNKMKIARKKKIANLINQIRKNKRFITCLMDESQNCKNDRVDSTQNVHQAIAAIQKRVSMTGTPSDDNPRDFYAQLQLVNYPGIAREGGEQSAVSFCRQYFAGYGTDDKSTAEDLRSNIIKHMGSARRFMDMICNFFLRRTKEQINPAHQSVRPTDNFHIIDANGHPLVTDERFWSDLTRKAYRTAAENKVLDAMQIKYERDIFNNLPQGTQIDEDRVQKILTEGLTPPERQQAILVQVGLQKVYTTAQQAIDHLKNMSTYSDKVKDANGNVVLEAPTPKMRASRGPNGKPLRDENKQIIYKPVLDQDGNPIMEQKPKMEQKQVPSKVLILTGSVPVAKMLNYVIAQKSGNPELVKMVVGGTSADDRGDISENFQNAKKNPRILIFTVKLGSVGYNFDVADLCIVNDPPWNPSLLEQGVNRVDRSMGKYKPTIIYNILSNDPSREHRSDNPTNGNLSIDDLQYKLIDSKGTANAAVQDCLQESAEIRKNLANNPIAREAEMDKLAERFVRSFADSLDAAEQARLFYNPPKVNNAMPVQVAAQSWYARFKSAAKQYRYLW